MSWKNWALMNQTNTKVDSDDKKMKIDRIMLKRIILGKVQGDMFLYISFKFDYRVSSYYCSVFLLVFRSPSPIASLFFYTLFPFHLYLPRAGQTIGIDTCSISTFPKSSCNSCKVENHCSGITSTLMRLKSLAAEHLM